MRTGILGLALGIALTAASAASAANPLQLEGYVQLEKIVIDEAGERRSERVDPITVVPGDRLIMGTRYVNEGAAMIESFVVSNPVPAAVRMAQAPDPAQIASVDGGRCWGAFGTLMVRAPDGTTRAAGIDDITHLRWAIPAVAPGGSGTIEFAVTVR